MGDRGGYHRYDRYHGTGGYGNGAAYGGGSDGFGGGYGNQGGNFRGGYQNSGGRGYGRGGGRGFGRGRGYGGGNFGGEYGGYQEGGRKRQRYFEEAEGGNDEEYGPDMKHRRHTNRQGPNRPYHRDEEEDDDDVEEDTIESRLEKLIVNIAEDTSTPLEYQLEKLADVLHEDIKRCGPHISKVT